MSTAQITNQITTNAAQPATTTTPSNRQPDAHLRAEIAALTARRSRLVRREHALAAKSPRGFDEPAYAPLFRSIERGIDALTEQIVARQACLTRTTEEQARADRWSYENLGGAALDCYRGW